MKFNLLGWKCEGLRCPDFNFELNKNSNALATFIQMPNGTGKTTTLRLLKRSLYNHEFKSTEIEEYQAKKNEFKKKGFFQAKFEVEGKIFYTKINFDFEKQDYSYSSSISDEGFKNNFRLPPEIENIVDKELIDLVFVDLEKDVKPMFRSYQTGAQEAIRKFCKINILKNVIKDFENFKNKKRKENIKSGSTKNQINTEETRENKIINKIAEVEKKVKEYKKYLHETQDKYDQGKKRLKEIIDSDTQLKKKRKELEKRRDETKSKYENLLIKNFETIKNIGSYDSTLKKEIVDFADNLDYLGLPEEEVTIFFDKILKRKNCICGEELNDDKKKVIKNEMKSFISISEARIIAAIKAAVSENTKEKEKSDLSENSSRIQDYSQELDALEQDIELIKDRALKDDIELSKENDFLQKERSKRKKYLDEVITQPWKAKDTEASTESLISLKEQKRIVEKKLADLSGTKDIEEKVSIISEILETAMDNAENEISKEITKECNKKIDKMFTKNPVFITSIKNYIVLDDQEEGSTGQEARIGIIFLLTILERSKIKFPLIVDTPVKGMDSAGTRRTARFISKLQSQFLCFIIDKDKPAFTDKFYEITDGKSNFITAFRRSEEFDKLAESESSNNNITTSYNGKVVDGYPFFEKFTEEDEGEDN